MALTAETRLSLFYYILGSNWIKMKKALPNKTEPKTWAQIIQACDKYRKTVCPSLTFDDLVRIMKDVHILTKENSEIFKTMTQNFVPKKMPLMDLEKYMGSIYDAEGIKAYVKYYKSFFDQLDDFVKFIENPTSNNP